MCRETPAWVLAMALYGEAAAIFEDDAAAASLLPLLAPLAGHLAAMMAVHGHHDRLRPRRPHPRPRRRRAGAPPSRRVPSTRAAAAAPLLFLGRELVLLADCRRRAGAPDDEVDALLAEALEIAERTGAKLIAQDAARRGLVAAP